MDDRYSTRYLDDIAHHRVIGVLPMYKKFADVQKSPKCAAYFFDSDQI
jgi:hypothetical protein